MLVSAIKSFFIPTKKELSQETISSIDIILYALNLASNPQLVTPYHERLREITSRITPGEKVISSEIQSDLAHLYIDIEKYLLEKEPLKKITKEELRGKIREKFHLQNNKNTFWDALPQ